MIHAGHMVMGLQDKAFALEDDGIDQPGGDPRGPVMIPGIKNVHRVPGPVRVPRKGSAC